MIAGIGIGMGSCFSMLDRQKAVWTVNATATNPADGVHSSGRDDQAEQEPVSTMGHHLDQPNRPRNDPHRPIIHASHVNLT